MKNVIETLMKEAAEFASKGAEINIVNPQSYAEEFNCKYLVVKGDRKLDLTRLDYLGLGSSSKIREIMIDCIKNYDISCPASQMVMKSGSNVKLESVLADFHGMSESIVFTTGYTANDNIIQALGLRMNTPHLAAYLYQTGMGQTTKNIPTMFFVDSDSHFSLQRGARLSKSQSKEGTCIISKFASMDYIQLEAQLEKSKNTEAVRVIISDTLSSCSGKMFDIKKLCELAEKYDCLLYLDEAHAIGALGPQGRGVAYEVTMMENYRARIIIMGTLTKVFCQLGGYVTMSNTFLSWFLRFCSPQYIFSAPVPPWMAETLVKMIALIKGDFGEAERQKLKDVSGYIRGELLRNGFNILDSNSHIVPIFIGDEAKSDSVKDCLEKDGFVGALFKYPATSKGNALIRLSLCSDVTQDEASHVIESLVSARKKIGF
ncbi:MAG: pyridoxal phosphate-dependent aminotransferase family protein [Nitrospirae bacterium]|nr:pyridoxal phosphate-dependent aminotransferase family protein [Nitrospirota bacterium]